MSEKRKVYVRISTQNSIYIFGVGVYGTVSLAESTLSVMQTMIKGDKFRNQQKKTSLNSPNCMAVTIEH